MTNKKTVPIQITFRICYIHINHLTIKISIMATTSKKISLVVSDSKSPSVTLKPGQSLHVKTINLIDANFKSSKIGAARLCGGTSTCVAIIQIDDEMIKT